ncbi:MAG TPA: IS3 family transposase [Flavisolibacter sp.]|nr:IS3 family transposase [Flavisolibacter sp.]
MKSFQGQGGARRSTGLIAATLGYSRQYFYKQQKDLAKEELKKQHVKHLIDQQRKLLPRLGTRKIHHLIKDELELKQIKFGRDKLFDLMREYNLLIKPQRRYVQTTNSKHWLKKWPNIIKDLPVNAPNEVWVSDITYIKTEEGNCYLNMVTDAFSRKIVGYAVDANMEAENMIKALKMATKQKNTDVLTIHHSDRGLQYCSKEYVQFSEQNNILLSMTEKSDPYENALAERMNRTIKEEFGINRKMKNKQQLEELLKESIDLYNRKRPHLSLKMKTPEEVYQRKKSRLPEAIGIN